jgi:hypothetical protein
MNRMEEKIVIGIGALQICVGSLSGISSCKSCLNLFLSQSCIGMIPA